MANNRMYLVCRGCNDGLLMGKTLGGGYYTFYDNMTKTLDDFYEEHAFCDKKNEVNWENQFEIRYESANEDGVKEY